MEEKRELVAREETLPAMTVGQAVKRYNEMVGFVKTIMREGIDYGVIPGTGGKPTLYKPGAEKLVTFFGYSFEPELIERVEDWQKPFFYYRYRGILKDKTGRIIAIGEASINSMESKYRWRNVPVWKATEEEKAAGTPIKRRGKDGKTLTFYQVPNDDIYSQVNSMQKIGQKRTLTGVVLLGCNASEFFTQDLEDIVEGEYAEEPEPQATEHIVHVEVPIHPRTEAEPRPVPSDEFDHAGARERVAAKRAARVAQTESDEAFAQQAQEAMPQAEVKVVRKLVYGDVSAKAYAIWKEQAGQAAQAVNMPDEEWGILMADLESEPITKERCAEFAKRIKEWKPPTQGAIEF